MSSAKNSVQRCDLLGAGCTEWQPLLDCQPNETCSEATCVTSSNVTMLHFEVTPGTRAV